MKAVPMNEEQGGYQHLTGFDRIQGNRWLGGKRSNFDIDDGLVGLYLYIQAVRKNCAGGDGNGGSTNSTKGLIALNSGSASVGLAAAQAMFNGMPGGASMAGLFSLNGNAFKEIEPVAFWSAYKQLRSEDAKALAFGYYSMINSDQAHYYGFFNQGDPMKDDLDDAGNGISPGVKGEIRLNYDNSWNFDRNKNGGAHTYTNVSLLANDPIIRLKLLHNGNIDMSYLPTHSYMFTHEVIGHGFASQALNGSGLKPYEIAHANNTAAVQTNNIYFRAIGAGYVDFGAEHYLSPGSNYNSIPRWYIPKVDSSQ